MIVIVIEDITIRSERLRRYRPLLAPFVHAHPQQHADVRIAALTLATDQSFLRTLSAIILPKIVVYFPSSIA